MQLVLVRHGQSIWNKENLFTGWTDVPLSEQGVAEAKEAGQLLKAKGYNFDIAHTSLLTRANTTLTIILEEMETTWLPTCKSWRLNERHYGALQGLNKEETAQKYGDDQVLLWRRSYDTLPPLLTDTDPRHPMHERRYATLDARTLPSGESLKTTLDRVIPYWEDHIAPDLKSGKNVIIAAHGNSLRALIKYLENIADDAIVALEIPTGNPLIYELDENFTILERKFLKE